MFESAETVHYILFCYFDDAIRGAGSAQNVPFYVHTLEKMQFHTEQKHMAHLVGS